MCFIWTAHCGQRQQCKKKNVHKRLFTQNLGYVFNDHFYYVSKACAYCLKFEYVYRFCDAGLRWVLSPRSCTASHSKILL